MQNLWYLRGTSTTSHIYTKVQSYTVTCATYLFLRLYQLHLFSNMQIYIHGTGEERQLIDKLEAVFKSALRMSSLPEVTSVFHANAPLAGCFTCSGHVQIWLSVGILLSKAGTPVLQVFTRINIRINRISIQPLF